MSAEPRTRGERLRFVLVSTFFWGLITHAYAFFHDNFSHDSANSFYSDKVSNLWKIQLGRFLVPYYQRFRSGMLILPWLTGILSLLYIALALYLITEILPLPKKIQIFLVAGLMTTNIAQIVLTASFMHDLDADCLALLMAVVAVFFWTKNKPLLGSICLVLSLGLYQSYFCVALLLIQMVCIVRLLNGKTIWKSALVGLLMCGVAGFVYLLLTRAICHLFNVSPADSSNGLNRLGGLNLNHIWQNICNLYHNFEFIFLQVKSAWQAQGVVRLAVYGIFFLSLCAVLIRLYENRRNPGNVIFSAILISLLPVSAYLTFVVNPSAAAEHTTYAFCLLPLLSLLLINCERGAMICAFLMLPLLWSGVVTANTAYLKKNMNQESTLALMNRVVMRIEEIPEYQPGVTQVAFIGISRLPETNPGFESLEKIDTLQYDSSITYEATYARYLSQRINSSLRFVDTDTLSALKADPRVQSMSAYPAVDCLQWVDGILVIRM